MTDPDPRPAIPHDLLEAAAAVQRHAYAPYSAYGVGAALRAGNGRIYVGVNVENAAYPVGTCAEAGAIAAMIAGGDRQIAEIAIVASGHAPPSPCGACRQRIREFARPDTRVHAMAIDGEGNSGSSRLSLTIDALLPHAFGPDVLP